jgi:hypothetical protein
MEELRITLTLAARHVARGRLIVARQIAQIARLRERGRSTEQAEAMLVTFETTQRILEDHERHVRDEANRARR